MQPSFGSIIWEQLFEPLTDSTREIISSDITRIIGYDPRLRVNNVTVVEENYGIMVQIELTYIPTDQTELLSLNFNKNSQTLTTN